MSSDEMKDLAVLYQIASLTNRSVTALAAQQEVFSSIMAAFPADSGSLALINPDSGRLEIALHRGFPEELGEFALRPGQGVTGWVALHGRRCSSPTFPPSPGTSPPGRECAAKWPRP